MVTSSEPGVSTIYVACRLGSETSRDDVHIWLVTYLPSALRLERLDGLRLTSFLRGGLTLVLYLLPELL
jgi:hypothetical protein